MALTVTQALAAFAGNTLADGTIIADTGRLVAENIDALLPLVTAGKIAGIELTNGGRPSMVVTTAQRTADATVLALITTPHSLQQRLSAAEAAGATLTAGFEALSVWDTGANIAANLPAIQTLWRAGTLGLVRLTDTNPVFSLSAAQVAANIDALRNIGSPFTITLTDGGTPTLTLPVWADSETTFSWVIASITSPFTLEINGVMRANRVASILSGINRSTSGETSVPLNPIAPLGGTSTAHLPSNLTVLDFQNRISTFIEALQAAAQAGKLQSVLMRDAGVQVLSLTPAQLTANAAAVSKFSPNVQLSQVIGAGDTAALVRDARFFNFTVEDTPANVLANIAAIDALAREGQLAKLRFTQNTADLRMTAAQLGSAARALGVANEDPQAIVLTDAGTPTVTVPSEAFASAGVRSNALNMVTGPMSLVVSGRVSANTAASVLAENNKVLASLAPGSLRIADFTSNVVSNISSLRQLATLGVIASIELINGGVQGLGISNGSATTNAAVLALITTPFSVAASPAKVTFTGTAAEMVAQFATLEASAKANTLGTITLTDGGTPVIALTAAQFTQNLEVLQAIAGAYEVNITGDATLNIEAWQFNSTIFNVFAHTVFTSTPTLAISGTIAASVAGIIATNIDPNENVPFVPGIKVADFASNIGPNIAALQALAAAGRLDSIAVIDNGGFGRITLTAAQLAAAPDVLAKITSSYILAKVVTVAEAATATIPDGAFDVLQVTDTIANIQANLPALQALAVNGKLTAVAFSGGSALSLSAQQVGDNADFLRLMGSTYTITLTNGGTPTITLKEWQVASNIASNVLSRISSPYTLVIDGPIRPQRVSTLASAGAGVFNHIAASSLVIRDYPTAISSRMADIQTLVAAGKVAAIDTRGGRPIFSLDAGEAVTFANVLALVNTPYTLSQNVTVAQIATATLATGFRDFTVVDSVANVLAGLSQVQALAAAGTLGRLLYTDTAPHLSLSAASLMSGLDAFTALDTNGFPIVLTDPGTPAITLPGYLLSDYYIRNNVLDAIASPWSLSVSGRVSVGAAAAVAAENNGVKSHLAGTLAVAGYGFDIAPDIHYLLALHQAGKLASLDILDTEAATFTFSTAEVAALEGVFGLTTDPYILKTEAGTTARTATADLARVVDPGFSVTHAIDVRDMAFAPSGLSFIYSAGSLQVLRNNLPLGTAGITAAPGVTYDSTSFYIARNAGAGTLIKAIDSTIGALAVTNTTLNTSFASGGTFYDGAVGYLQRQFINGTGNSVNIGANIPNVFLHGGGVVGNNALQVLSGQNVLDGGTGSNFLVGGVGFGSENADTFFLDGRGGGVSWGTVVNFHAGDAVTFWGWKDGITTFDWFANDGALGFQGATIHARLNGGTGAYDASITFAGVDLATAQSWSILKGTTGGLNTYAYIQAT